MERISCILCDSKINFKQEETVKDRFNENAIYNIVKCKCGMILLNPRISADKIFKHYQHSSYQPHYKNNTLIDFFYRIAQIRNNKFKLRTINLFHKKGSILDYGAGDGQFCRFMLKKKWDAKLYDPFFQEDSVLSININKLQNRCFDVITMFHSLEHLHNIHETLDNLCNILNKDGVLILSVPNHNAYERDFFGPNWVAYDAPRHLYHFNYQTIKLFLNKNGFKVLMTKSMYLDTFYNILMSLDKNILLFPKFIFMSLLSIFKIICNKQSSSSLLLVCKKK